MDKITRVTVELERGGTKSFEGPGTLHLVDTRIKQDAGPDIPTKYVEVHMEVK